MDEEEDAAMCLKIKGEQGVGVVRSDVLGRLIVETYTE